MKHTIANSNHAPSTFRRRSWRLMGAAGLASAALFGVTACSAGDEEFPSDTIEMIIPYAAGGSTDVSLRLMASIAEDTCGTNIIASNQTGSAGAVGFTATSNAEPDGYTVGATAHEIAILHQLGIAQITPNDLRGVMRYALNPHVVFVPESSPYETIDDLISAAESGTIINVATPGTGSAAHLSLEGMALEAGLEGAFTNIPFDGDGTALQALVGEQADMVLMTGGTGLPQVEAGTIRALAVASEERLDYLPDTPTLMESGIDWESGAHLGLAVPKETPDDRVAILDECLHEAIESDRFQEGMAEQNFNVAYLPPAEFETYLGELEEQYGEVIERAGLGG